MVDGNPFPYTGQITFADPSYNPTTGTFLLRATVRNPEGVLRPNQYVRRAPERRDPPERR
jgi:membrane fusion protein (multidrug efflux system)